MDEIEARLAALELLVMERLALDPPGTLRQLREALDVEAFGEERTQRDQALQILDDAIARFDAFAAGWRLRGPPPAD